MFAGRDIVQHFPSTFSHLNAKLYLAKPPVHAAQNAFERLIEARRHVRNQKMERVSAPLAGLEHELFAKSQPLDNLRPKIRVTLWRAKRDGMFDWPLEEVINTFEAQRRDAPVARLAGFGYSKSAVGVTQEFFIFTELLSSHINGMDWIQSPDNDIEAFIRRAFRLLKALHDKSLTHMDFWANNVMVSLTPDEPDKAIDLENCFLGSSRKHTCETLAFQFGFFYRREIYRFITEARYDQLVHEELANHYSVDMERFTPIYLLAKHEVISRRARRETFLSGTVVTG
ncbi:hypothetical protein EGJ27_19035 [Pseudomonas sp. v388]|uniref:hypothetical protein n=1 Tax=Pseudomonas sp. v388 TaxID=2479849 RepID=UPI000F79B30B|nr:hypothetical protein [Pseudomonas sp. v388]RRV05265.1 hypothetical protein EGJ27_19035 [Pseudomonas sp. v388]